MIYKIYIKTNADKLTAFLLLVFCLPIFFIISATMLILGERPIFFKQKRTGKNKISFTLYKFRTLKPADSTDLSMSDRKFTIIGSFLRNTGLDELPQLINILNGEMSVVGPRPLPIEYESKYNPTERQRFEVLPGITGWAQVHGRNDISWAERFEKDLWYVKHASLALDLKIIMITAAQLLNRLFVQRKPLADMPVFEGSDNH